MRPYVRTADVLLFFFTIGKLKCNKNKKKKSKNILYVG